MRMDSLLNARLKAAGDEFKPAVYYLEKWDTKLASMPGRTTGAA